MLRHHTRDVVRNLKKMSLEKTLLVLWVIFGFVFIQAVDSILFFLTHLVYFGSVSLGISYSLLNFILPIVTVLTYLATIILLLKRINIDSNTSGDFLTEFPKKMFLVLLVIALVLNPITNKLSGLFAEYNSQLQIENPTDFIQFYGWMHFGIVFGRWASIIILGLIYIKKYNTR